MAKAAARDAGVSGRRRGELEKGGPALGPELVGASQAGAPVARAAARARKRAALDPTHLPIHRALVQPQARDPNPRLERP